MMMPDQASYEGLWRVFEIVLAALLALFGAAIRGLHIHKADRTEIAALAKALDAFREDRVIAQREMVEQVAERLDLIDRKVDARHMETNNKLDYLVNRFDRLVVDPKFISKGNAD